MKDLSYQKKSREKDIIAIDNSDQTEMFETIKKQMAYHTLESKSICEKRDLNNVPSISKKVQNPELQENIKTFLNPRNLYQDHNALIDNQSDQMHQCRFDNDHLLGQNEKFCGVRNSSDLTSEPYFTDKSKIATNLCNINLSTILCWICCIVCLFCVYTATTLRLHSKVIYQL